MAMQMWRLFGIWCSENHYSRKITNFTETNLSQQVGIRDQGYVGTHSRYTCYDWLGGVALQRVNQADDSQLA